MPPDAPFWAGFPCWRSVADPGFRHSFDDRAQHVLVAFGATLPERRFIQAAAHLVEKALNFARFGDVHWMLENAAIGLEMPVLRGFPAGQAPITPPSPVPWYANP